MVHQQPVSCALLPEKASLLILGQGHLSVIQHSKMLMVQFLQQEPKSYQLELQLQVRVKVLLFQARATHKQVVVQVEPSLK